MSSCDMCGKSSQLFVADVEGVKLSVCKSCSSHGKIIRKPVLVAPKKKRIQVQQKKEIVQRVREDAGSIIRQKREKLGLKQKEFAKMLNERESLIQRIETSQQTPSLELARKLERSLKVDLVVQKEVEKYEGKSKSTSVTIGDIINIK